MEAADVRSPPPNLSFFLVCQFFPAVDLDWDFNLNALELRLVLESAFNLKLKRETCGCDNIIARCRSVAKIGMECGGASWKKSSFAFDLRPCVGSHIWLLVFFVISLVWLEIYPPCELNTNWCSRFMLWEKQFCWGRWCSVQHCVRFGFFRYIASPQKWRACYGCMTWCQLAMKWLWIEAVVPLGFKSLGVSGKKSRWSKRSEKNRNFRRCRKLPELTFWFFPIVQASAPSFSLL